LILFCPFTTTGNWTEKIVFDKKSKDFCKINGGLEYVKNSKEQGNPELLKRWLKAGFNIPVVDKVRGSQNLIYFSAFGDSGYINLLKYLLKGLVKQPYKNFDLLFITDKKTKPLIEKNRLLKKFNVHYMITERITDTVEASMQKLKIYQFEKLNDYSKILFLDLDIFIVGDLATIFEEKIRPNVLYTAIHKFSQNIHKTSYHTIEPYSDEHLERLDKMNVFPFNAGQFLFMNTSTMVKHFKNIFEFTSKWDGRYFFEQSFMNTYFNTLQLSNVFKFKDQFCFVSVNTGQVEIVTNPDSVVVHYMGGIGSAKAKIDHMKKHYKYLFP
jgi:hypothetical protein